MFSGAQRMSPKFKNGLVRWIHCFLGLVLLFPLAAYAQQQDYPLLGGDQQQAIDPALAHKLSLANGYHDLAILLIKKGEPEAAAEEARKIIDLRIPPPFEQAVAESLGIITNRLGEAGRYDLGQALLDAALKTAPKTSTQIKLYQTKARLYMLAGDNDSAIASWRQALELESRRVP